MPSPRPHNLAATRCRNHPDREAVAFCRECAHYFCRECVVEHGGRMVCTHCLQELLASRERPATPKVWTRLGQGLLALGGLALAWLLFSVLGRALISLRVFVDGWRE